jgi:hypothetical protein
MELIIHLGSNHDSDVFFVIDFVNLKIKSVKYFECVYRDRMYIRVFIGVNAHTYISIYVCIVFLTKKLGYSYNYIWSSTGVSISPKCKAYGHPYSHEAVTTTCE